MYISRAKFLAKNKKSPGERQAVTFFLSAYIFAEGAMEEFWDILTNGRRIFKKYVIMSKNKLKLRLTMSQMSNL